MVPNKSGISFWISFLWWNLWPVVSEWKAFGKNSECLCAADNHHFLPWIIWSYLIQRQTTNKRNWHSQSTRRLCSASRFIFVLWVQLLYTHIKYHCLAHCLLCHEQMATKFCLSDQSEHLDFHAFRTDSPGDCPYDRELSIHQSGHG